MPDPTLDTRALKEAAESKPETYICWHGTDEATAQIILREGFKPYTHFAAHMEDAIAFGGPFVFDVIFDEAPPNWQFRPPERIQPDRIRALTRFWSMTLFGESSFTRTEVDATLLSRLETAEAERDRLREHVMKVVRWALDEIEANRIDDDPSASVCNFIHLAYEANDLLPSEQRRVLP